MVQTFLSTVQDTDPENADLTMKLGSVGLAETLSVFALALRLRWADPHAPQRYHIKTAGLQVFVLGCMLILAATAIQMLLGTLVFVVHPPPDAQAGSLIGLLFPAETGGWGMVRQWAFVLWIPAFVLASRGSRRRVMLAMICAAVPTIVSVGWLTAAFFRPATSAFIWDELLRTVIACVVIAGMLSMSATTARPVARNRRRWLIAPTILLAVYNSVLLTLWLALPPPALASVFSVITDDAGFWYFSALIVALGLAACRIRGKRIGTVNLVGLTWLATAATLRGLCMLPLWIEYSRQGAIGSPLMLTLALSAVAITACIAACTGVAATVRIRRIPIPPR